MNVKACLSASNQDIIMLLRNLRVLESPKVPLGELDRMSKGREVVEEKSLQNLRRRVAKGRSRR